MEHSEDRVREAIREEIERHEKGREKRWSDIEVRLHGLEASSTRLEIMQTQLTQIAESIRSVQKHLIGDLGKPGLAVMVDRHEQRWLQLKWLVGGAWAAIMGIAAKVWFGSK